MTVKTINANLLTSDCDVIIHQANCFATMGAGIAKQIKARFPEAYESDKHFYIPPGNPARLGRFSRAKSNDKYIINLYGQYHYGRGLQTDADAFYQSLDRILNHLLRTEYHDKKVGMPYGIGCGLAGGDWNDIRKIIIELSDVYNIDIYLYRYQP